MSDTGSWMTCAPRTTWNFCSCSMRLCKPLNCFSLLQSLKAVTRTTQTTDSRIAAPSIQPASASPSSSAPAFAAPQAAERDTRQEVRATLTTTSYNRCVSRHHTISLFYNSSIKHSHTRQFLGVQAQILQIPQLNNKQYSTILNYVNFCWHLYSTFKLRCLS